ncbi:hypothetical protein P3342_000478 [Pyrenophora teres f. teres]|uniref:Uncharacterized protein n=2 Tax=Pyrenophora teres f. teres TaxID=97479 RepID=E3S7E1_PYRTT|nr:hypothetical protein PTT_18734 [Pyrenophora teres f. teres 0-1]KAE8836349.1 hypothetical protein HRS9139_04447 [Pyrenophora teres f. teres]KAE8837680.1 hypothetical protein PTNB85_05015 [Pyrenophora teres f. teres]KAE8839900.1 hypothetical protein HRS9122_06505 [Pyrenophora teres f. teres]KAE8862503.1 hypothetical protein PTNB29_05065 [Pyrenophora teres f. teres]
MKTSKYAPKTPAESLAQSKADKLKQDKDRVSRLLGRLRWKAEMLWVSYNRTMEIVQAAAQQQDQYQSQHTMGSGASSKQAESMFKVDFFEFYTLLERYITDCLAIFGISVSASVPRQNFNALRYEINPDLHRTRPMASHAFHANLLEALDNENCPLSRSLGLQEVRVQLSIAKEYRNAWKDADAKANLPNGDNAKVQLQDLQLELMLHTIIAGCNLAHGAVQEYDKVSTGQTLTSRDFVPKTYGHTSMDIEDTPYEYMDDAMDLD